MENRGFAALGCCPCAYSELPHALNCCKAVIPCYFWLQREIQIDFSFSFLSFICFSWHSLMQSVFLFSSYLKGRGLISIDAMSSLRVILVLFRQRLLCLKDSGQHFLLLWWTLQILCKVCCFLLGWIIFTLISEVL